MTNEKHHYLNQLYSAGSYWGMRYAEIVNCRELGTYSGTSLSDQLCYLPDISNEVVNKLFDEINSRSESLIWEYGEKHLQGYWLLQFIQLLSAIIPALIGSILVAVTAFLPLHLLSKFSSNENEYSQRAFMVIDLKTIKGDGLDSNDNSTSSKVEKPPLPAPAPPTGIMLQVVP